MAKHTFKPVEGQRNQLECYRCGTKLTEDNKNEWNKKLIEECSVKTDFEKMKSFFDELKIKVVLNEESGVKELIVYDSLKHTSTFKFDKEGNLQYHTD